MGGWVGASQIQRLPSTDTDKPLFYLFLLFLFSLCMALKRQINLFYYHGERKDSKGVHLPAESFNDKVFFFLR